MDRAFFDSVSKSKAQLDKLLRDKAILVEALKEIANTIEYQPSIAIVNRVTMITLDALEQVREKEKK